MSSPLSADDTADEIADGATSGRMPNLWRVPQLRAVVLTAVAGFAGFFLTQSALGLYAAQSGASEGVAGLAVTALLLTTVLGQGFVAGAVRRFGHTGVLAAGLVLLAAPTPAYLIEPAWWWLAAVSALRGLGFAVVTVLLPLLATRAAPPGRSGAAIGLYGLAIAVPNLALVPAGVALTASGHFAVVAWLALLPLLALPLAPGLGAMMAAPSPAGPLAAGPTGWVATARRIAGVAAVLLTVTLTGSALVTFLPIARPDGGLATAALLAFGLTGALTRWRAAALSDRVGVRLLLPLGVAGVVTGTALVWIGLASGGTAPVLIGCLVGGTGFGAVQNLTLIVAFRLAGPADAPTASAVWNTAFDAGAALGATAVGALAATGLGLPAALGCCAGLVALTMPLAWTVSHRPAGD